MASILASSRSSATTKRSAASSLVSISESTRLTSSTRVVGMCWAGPEHLLVTSTSQVVLYSVVDGFRVREWSFRPSKPLAFLFPVYAASEQGLMVGVQGQHRLVAWPGSMSSSSTTSNGNVMMGEPEGLMEKEVDFAIHRMEQSNGIIWILGSDGQVAAYSSIAPIFSTLGLHVPVGSQSKGVPRACLVSPKGRYCLAVFGTGLRCYQCPSTRKALSNPSSSNEQQQLSLCVSNLIDLQALSKEIVADAQLQSCDLMWSHVGSTGAAYLWTVWTSASEGRVFWQMARITVAIDDHASSGNASATGDSGQAPALSVVTLYSKEKEREGEEKKTASSTGRKRRRSSTSSEIEALATPPEIIGMQSEGVIMMCKGDGLTMQAWDAEHGVLIQATEAEALSQAKRIAAGEGVLAGAIGSSKGTEIIIWRVEARVGAEGGLRRVIGRIRAPSTIGGKVFKFSSSSTSSQNGWMAEEGQEAETGRIQSSVGDGGVEGLFEDLKAHQNKQLQVHLDGPEKKRGKISKAFSLAGRDVSPKTALEVVEVTLKGDANQERQELLWNLLKALIKAGKIPIRDRVSLMDELMDMDRMDLVQKVLSGPADVPERCIIRTLKTALFSDKIVKDTNEGVNQALKLVSLAVGRPCCPAFLRGAMGELDGPTAALLLLLLRSLLGQAMSGTAAPSPSEEQVVAWLEALLDANFVNMVMEASSSAATSHLLQKSLQCIQEKAGEAAQACEALKTVEGYIQQFKRAGHALEVVPDYSLDYMPI